MNDTSKEFIENSNQIISDIKRTFELRHIFCHEFATNLNVDQDEIVYSPAPDAGFTAYQNKITMREKMMKVTPDFWEKQPKNAKGVAYVAGTLKDSNGNTTVTFRTKSSSMELSIPASFEGDNFSGQKVWDTVVNSFEIKQ